MIQARYRSEDAHRPAPNGTVNANTRQSAGDFGTVVDAWYAHLIVGLKVRVVLILVQVESGEPNPQLAQERCAEFVRIVHRKQLVLSVGGGRISTADRRSAGNNAK